MSGGGGRTFKRDETGDGDNFISAGGGRTFRPDETGDST